MNTLTARQISLETLSGFYGCGSEAFKNKGITFLARSNDNQTKPNFITLATFGSGVVVCCDKNLLQPITMALQPMDRDEVFSSISISIMNGLLRPYHAHMVGPVLKSVCTLESFKPVYKGFDVKLVEKEELHTLFRQEGFHNALGYRTDGPRPDAMAAYVEIGNEPVAVAGASSDYSELWQIGVDVLPAWRGQGLGRAAVSLLTEELLKRGILPFYSTLPSNLASRRLAEGLGYQSHWVELYSKQD